MATNDYHKDGHGIAKLFSAKVLGELAQRGSSPAVARIIKHSFLADEDPNLPLSDIYDKAFRFLKRPDNRHEYVYKAAIIQKILLGKHSLNTATLINEFRVGTSKADIVILNGSAIAYEIKTERDSLDRLETQIDNYRKMFGEVNVICGENHYEKVESLVPEGIGIMTLSPEYQISTQIPPIENSERITPEIIFDSIRLSEVELILRKFKIELDGLSNGNKYYKMRDEFMKLPIEKIYNEMVKTLKDNRNKEENRVLLSKHLTELPNCLSPFILSRNLNELEGDNLSNVMNTPSITAKNWE